MITEIKEIDESVLKDCVTDICDEILSANKYGKCFCVVILPDGREAELQIIVTTISDEFLSFHY